MSTETHHPIQVSLCQRLDQLQQVADHFADKDFYCELNELRVKVTDQKLNLVVVGHFKRGKSSLVNAILGKELAPVAITPLTTVVTTFEHHPDKSFACVLFKKGESLETDQSAAASFISEEENPANDKKVDSVRIFDHTLPLLQMVTLIDTPGIGSAYTYNTESTREFIPRIDAALFVLSADLPVTQADVEFLKELKPVVPHILYVLNKKDLVDEGDLRKMIDHNSRVLRRHNLMGSDEHILAVSAKLWQDGRTVESGITGVLAKIRQLMGEEKEALLQEVFKQRYFWLHSRLLPQLRLKLESLMLPLDELSIHQKRLKEVMLLLNDQKLEFEHTIRGETRLLQEFIQRSIQQDADELKAAFQSQTEDTIGHLMREKTISVYQSDWNRRILDRFEHRRQELETEVRRKFQNLLAQYAQRSKSFLNELIAHLASLMGMDFDLIAGKFDLDVYTSFYLSQEGDASADLRLSVFEQLLPARQRQRRVLKRLCQHFNALVVRHSASVIYDLQYRIQESFRQFSYSLDNRLRDLLGNMERLLAETMITRTKHHDKIDQQIHDLQVRIDTLQQISSSTI